MKRYAAFVVGVRQQIKQLRLSYLKSFWNVLDIVVIVMALCCICFNIYRTVEVNNLLEKLLSNPDQYSDFETLSYYEMVFNSALAIMVFFAWIKVGRQLKNGFVVSASGQTS